MFDQFCRPPFAFQGPEGPLPWMRHGHHHHHHHHHGFGRGPHMFAMRLRRAIFGNEPPFEGFFGGGPRFFGRGDIKYALLELLQERPMHGYEMMKALEERSGGFYVASAGSIYPTLQMLEDRGLVSVNQEDGKKVYSITDTGRAFLAERYKEDEGRQWHGFGPGRHRPGPEFHALRNEAGEVARLFVIAGRSSFRDAEKLTRLRSILERTRKELTDLIYNDGKAEAPSSEKQPPATDQA